ncbi:hypothetical protein OFY17_02455 [Marinomonas sp. C2222]|uniref:Uncharacterized protein n=1 Tax=Marinomonas sargassi TaxID=2984494 RepID=A0ABT2YPC7_9GAMM|nr:hypothetical protein [Marinomonas sargassi]MCV2401737.1 hypothetical protein [Marinomonas sargassi]
MGIVVTVFMALILAFSLPKPLLKLSDSAKSILLLLAFFLGCWNALAYGLQHLGQLWGDMALISGIAMIITSINAIGLSALPSFFQHSFIVKFLLPRLQAQVHKLPSVIHLFILLVLFACFCMYAYTLVLLNLQ